MEGAVFLIQANVHKANAVWNTKIPCTADTLSKGEAFFSLCQTLCQISALYRLALKAFF